jgi:hypothetical protein
VLTIRVEHSASVHEVFEASRYTYDSEACHLTIDQVEGGPRVVQLGQGAKYYVMNSVGQTVATETVGRPRSAQFRTG